MGFTGFTEPPDTGILCHQNKRFPSPKRNCAFHPPPQKKKDIRFVWVSFGYPRKWVIVFFFVVFWFLCFFCKPIFWGFPGSRVKSLCAHPGVAPTQWLEWIFLLDFRGGKRQNNKQD